MFWILSTYIRALLFIKLISIGSCVSVQHIYDFEFRIIKYTYIGFMNRFHQKKFTWFICILDFIHIHWWFIYV